MVSLMRRVRLWIEDAGVADLVEQVTQVLKAEVLACGI